uniref:Uncharacterized protein n=1 Tax=viral metagenome TaxID=1070528 RepID=A0A6C0LRY4_9ZZZZ
MDFQSDYDIVKRFENSEPMTNIYYNNNSRDSLDQLNSIEKDFYAIYNKAKEYRERLSDVVIGGKKKIKVDIYEESEYNLYGGQEKKKRTVNKKLMLGIGIAKDLRAMNKYNLKWPEYIAIANLILKDAITRVGSDKDLDVVLAKAKELLKNPESYVVSYSAVIAEKGKKNSSK